MTRTQRYQQFRDAVAETKLAAKFDSAPVVAVLTGPCEVIECVVMHAAKDCGIEMDWGYSGGRAFVHALGDAEKARDALVWAMPGGLSVADLGQPML